MPISPTPQLPFSHFPHLTLDELRQALSERENHLRSINGWLSIVTLISDINKLKTEIAAREQDSLLLPKPQKPPKPSKKNRGKRKKQ